jgi:hypothetical protein
MRKSLIKNLMMGLALLPLLPAPGTAQDFNNYKPLEARWVIPADFTGRSSQKYYKDVATIDAKDSRFAKKSKKDFFLESNFGMGDFLTSGRVLFNDEASAYLTEVLDVLLKDNQELRKQLRIYVVKSPAVNAFATNNGIIFVTMGMLARLENEAQLAWILSHEVIHYREQHVINSYIKGQEIKQSKGMYKRLSLDEKDYAKSSFNKEQEMESDTEGLTLFLNTDYAKAEALKVYDLLAQAHLPQQDKSFRTSYFETKNFVFPAKLKLDTVKQRSIRDDYDDTKSSHPKLKKRKEAAAEAIKKAPKGFADKAYVVSGTTFNKVRSIAAFEVLREQLLSGEYIDAFYQAYVLHEQYPNSEYVQSAIGKALYGLAKWAPTVQTDGYEGNIQRFAHLSKQQQPLERIVLALRYLYPLHVKYPQNEELELMTRDLLVELALKDEQAERRFARLDQPASEHFKNEDWAYLQFAFSDFQDQPAFYTLFDDIMGRVRTAQKELEGGRKKNKQLERPKPAVDKVLVVQPVYQKVDHRKKKSIRHEASEDVLVSLNDKIRLAADKLQMQATLINTNTIASSEIALFNNHIIVQDWLREKLQHETPDGVSPIHNELREVMKQHDTDYLVWMGGLSLTERNTGLLSYALLSLLSPIFVAPALYTAFVPKKHTFFFAFTFDTRRESLLANDVRLMKMKDNNPLLQSNIYYTLFKLKHPKKREQAL